MNVVIRTDAGVSIGHGHVMRCVTLAIALRERGARVEFVCRQQDGDLCDFIAAQGFALRRMPPDALSWQSDAQHTRIAVDAARADWLVVDHYALDQRWEAAARPADGALMVIDDLADRSHDCDLLLDQNYFPDAASRYDGLIPAYCSRFLGPEYVLLRAEFGRFGARRGPRERRLLIFFGGGDPGGQSARALEAALEFDSELPLDVILGGNNPCAAALEAQYGGLANLHLLRRTDDMAGLMARASLCLGAGGIATFERIYMGLPSIVVSTADNQREPLDALARLGCLDYLGEAANVDRSQWVTALRRWHANPVPPTPLPVATQTERVLAALEVRLTPFVEGHIASTFEFVCDVGLRASFAMEGEPDWAQHAEYWRSKLAAGVERVFAIERAGKHVGNCGIKPIPDTADHEGWIYLSPAIERRSGLGELAFRRLMRTAFRTMGLERLYLHVRRDNAAALALYEKIGFRPAEEPVDRRVWGRRGDEMHKLVLAA